MAHIDFSKLVTAEQKAAEARAETLAIYQSAIQGHLDAKAQERQYDNIQTAVSYRDDPNPVFAAEASALFAWRSAVWTAVMTMLAEVDEEAPPTVEAVIAELPAFAWPE